MSEVPPSRTDVRSVPCPACHAAVGASCVGARDKPREGNHTERVAAWQAVQRSTVVVPLRPEHREWVPEPYEPPDDAERARVKADLAAIRRARGWQ